MRLPALKGRAAISRSRLRFWRASANSGCSSWRAVASSSSRSAASTRSCRPGMAISCSSSFGVKAACAGPRRASRQTSSTPLLASACRAWSAISVLLNCAWGSTNRRAISSATLPIPMITAVVPDRSGAKSASSGCPLYPPTKLDEPKMLPLSAPGRLSGRLCEPPVA